MRLPLRAALSLLLAVTALIHLPGAATATRTREPYLAFVNSGPPTDPNGIVLLARDGSRIPLVTAVGPTCDSGAVWSVDQPEWSPDATRIAYVEQVVWQTDSCTDGSAEQRLTVASVSGGDPLELVTSAHGIVPSGWSPDGSQVYFTEGNPLGLWSVGADEGDPAQVNALRGWQLVSPDGTRVALIRFERESDQALVVASIDGGERLRLAGIGPYAYGPDVAWFPNGRRLAFVRSYPARIVIARADGGGNRVVWEDDAATIQGIDVSASGGSVVFARDLYGVDGPTLVVLDLASGMTHPVDPGPGFYQRTPAWRPSGS